MVSNSTIRFLSEHTVVANQVVGYSIHDIQLLVARYGATALLPFAPLFFDSLNPVPIRQPLPSQH